MPTAILGAFRNGQHEESRLLRIEPGEINLEKLSRLDAVGDRVLDGSLSVGDGIRAIEVVIQSPPLFPRVVKALCFGIQSGAMAVFLRGRLADVLAAFVAGLLIGGLDRISGNNVTLRRNFEALAAFLATGVALALSHWVDPHISVQATTLASLIILMPGMSFTVGMAELSTQNLVAGTARLMGAGMTLLRLIFGVVLATESFRFLFHAVPPDSPAFQVPTTWLKDMAGLLLVIFPLSVLFNVHRRDWIWIALAVGTSFYSTKWAGQIIGPELGVFVGGLCIAVVSNTFARFRNRPATLLLLPGILLLVPGSLGYRSLTFLSEQNVLGGVDAGFKMVFIASAIVAGMFFGNSLVPPRRSL
jgi:uncharacterized membrane protein YjjP (DUF1212 family)